jgi:hypothetical protein
MLVQHLLGAIASRQDIGASTASGFQLPAHDALPQELISAHGHVIADRNPFEVSNLVDLFEDSGERALDSALIASMPWYEPSVNQ